MGSVSVPGTVMSKPFFHLGNLVFCITCQRERVCVCVCVCDYSKELTLDTLWLIVTATYIARQPRCRRNSHIVSFGASLESVSYTL